MKTIVLLGFLVLLILFLSWKLSNTENLAMEVGNIDIGPAITMRTVEAFAKNWSPIKEKIGSENFDIDIGPEINANRHMNMIKSWEPDTKEFEKILRKVDKNEDKRDDRKKALACSVDITTKDVEPYFSPGFAELFLRNYAPWNLVTDRWNLQDWIRANEDQCKRVKPAMTPYSAALKCALDTTDNDEDFKKLIVKELKPDEYLQRRQCQGYFVPENTFI